MTTLKIPANKRIYCNRCKGDTNHKCTHISAREEHETDDEGCPLFTESWKYHFWVCLGCETACIEERYSNDGMMADGDYVWNIEYHPQKTHNQIRSKNYHNLPNKLAKIYKESITAFNNNAEILTAVGLRALIEGIAKDKKIKGKDLQEKIDKLSPPLPVNIVKNLHSFRFMGNAATHELEPPSNYELKLAIEVCEDLLNFLYELDYKTARLGEIGDRRHKPTTPEVG